jgi:hypothetical protein
MGIFYLGIRAINHIWNISGPHHRWCQLFWKFLWFLSVIPDKFTAVFIIIIIYLLQLGFHPVAVLQKVHGQLSVFPLPLNHLVI